MWRAGGPSGDGPRTVAWFHCFAGIAGDMALGSLLDAGADLREVLALLERLPLGGWSLEAEPVLRGGIAATRAVVSADGQRGGADPRPHRRAGRVRPGCPNGSPDGRWPPSRPWPTWRRGCTGGRSTRSTSTRSGGHDTIVDVVGTAAALEVLGVDEVQASPVATGLGMVRAAHGLLPNPSPAVVALLEGVPTWGRDVPVELTTPTGAALLAALASGYGPMPAMRVTGQGFGAGSRELDELPNCTQVVTGVRVDGQPGSGTEADAGQPVSLLEANVDDATGEQLAHAVGALLEAGAHDAWLTPVVMKKGRPGTVIHVLGDPSQVARLRAVLREATGSLGVRVTAGQRWPAARAVHSVWVDGQMIRVKVAPGRIKAEYDDVARASRRSGQSLREVAFRAEAQWREDQGGRAGTGTGGDDSGPDDGGGGVSA